MIRIALCLALTVITVAQVEAGPFGLLGRRNNCSSGSCSSNYSNALVGGGCSSGQCAAPVLAQAVQAEEAVAQVQAEEETVQWAVSQERMAQKGKNLVNAFKKSNATQQRITSPGRQNQLILAFTAGSQKKSRINLARALAHNSLQ